jgi:hypothetical protein
VRIAAHAITTAALVVVPASASGAPPVEIASGWVEQSQAQQLIEHHGLGIDHGRRPGMLRVFGPREALETLASDGRLLELEIPSPPPTEGYRMPKEGGEVLRALAQQGDRVGHAIVGHSVDGLAIEGVWIGQPPESGAPTYRVLAGHHGDEWSSFEVALATATTLAEADGVDTSITEALDQLTIWIVPYVNPDGILASDRLNRHGVDLNRNYDYKWTAESYAPGQTPFSEPETRAVRTLSIWTQPMAGLSLHSGAANLGWVWNWSTTEAPDAAALEWLANGYADLTTSDGFWVTNGATWYVSNGDTNDWAYGRLGQWDYTLELTEQKSPPADAIPNFVDDHVQAIVDMVTRPPDVSGQVVDGETGEPIGAQITAEDSTGALGQPFFAEPSTGWFHHQGQDIERLHVQAPGYGRQTLPVAHLDTIQLAPSTLDARMVLPVAPWETAVLELPDAVDTTIILSQPGHPDVHTTATAGGIELDTTTLAGGAWTVARGDGPVHPRSVLIEDAALAIIDGWQVTGDGLMLQGAGLVAGTRAWALFGETRAMRPLPTEKGEDGAVLLDLTEVPSSGRVDIWIVAAGEHLFIGDIYDTAPKTNALGHNRPFLVGRACACDVKTGHLPGQLGSVLVVLALFFRSRRR